MRLIVGPLWITTLCCLSVIGTATAQVSKETLESIETPDQVETSIGTLQFLDGALLPENNWLETVPGKGWFIALRMYGPLKPWMDKTWRPGEIERVK